MQCWKKRYLILFTLLAFSLFLMMNYECLKEINSTHNLLSTFKTLNIWATKSYYKHIGEFYGFCFMKFAVYKLSKKGYCYNVNWREMPQCIWVVMINTWSDACVLEIITTYFQKLLFNMLPTAFHNTCKILTTIKFFKQHKGLDILMFLYTMMENNSRWGHKRHKEWVTCLQL